MQVTASEFSNTLLEVEQLNSSLESYQQSLANYGKNPTESNLLNTISKFNEFLVEAKSVNKLRITDEEDQQRIELFQEKMTRIKDKMNIVTEQQNVTVAIQLSSIINGVLNDVHLLSQSLKEQYDVFSKQNNWEIVYLFIFSGVMLLGIASVSTYISTRKIVKPIQLLNEYSKRISAGDLEIKELELNSKDEIGQLTNSFNTMRQSLFTLVRQLRRNADKLQTLANTDELTKLYNRRFFMSAGKQMDGQSFSIIIFDIDNFKRINDTYGHLVGDKMIVHVASLLKSVVTQKSICGRFGGEEFIVLLPEKGKNEAMKQAENLRFIIEQSSIAVDDEQLSVTCSFGVADSTGMSDVMSVVRKADTGLYFAKENGKNTIKSVV